MNNVKFNADVGERFCNTVEHRLTQPLLKRRPINRTCSRRQNFGFMGMKNLPDIQKNVFTGCYVHDSKLWVSVKDSVLAKFYNKILPEKASFYTKVFMPDLSQYIHLDL